ncbi:MAG TPA: hypothetical protein VFF69_11580 [Phycisphaerales bacterium]|nr:hypothetical protein [Phycisphaerales bacterium]
MRTPLPALLSLALLCAPAAADGEAIAALLERMERAVLAADPEGYLECVDNGTSAEWNREQDNWAADLMHHVPEEFEMELTAPPEPWDHAGTLHDPAILDEVRRAPVRVSWLLPDGPRRAVEFPAMFVRRIGEWRYAGEAWRRRASEDGQNIVLYLDDGLVAVAERVIDIMPEIRAHVDEGFETRLGHPQVVKLYDEMTHLQHSIYLSYTEPLGGWNEPGESIKILADRHARSRQLRILLAHEYGHVATFTYSPEASEHIPWWVAEGVAELAAERFAGPAAVRSVDEVVRAWVGAGALAEWSAMADFRQTPSELHGHVYIQGHHFVGFVSERFGRARRNHWIRLLAQGSPLDEASREAFALSFAELDALWRASLEDKTAPPDDG